MFICTIATQKGGVGKTTTTLNLGTALALMNKRVLLIDMDPQANLTDALDINTTEIQKTVFNLLERSTSVQDVIIHHSENLDMIPSNSSPESYSIDISLSTVTGRENRLKKSLESLTVTNMYDYVLIDCPSNLGLLTVNALCAANALLVPVQAEYFSLSGLELMYLTFNEVREELNEHLKIIGILITFYDERKNLNRDVVEEIDKVWGGRFNTKIRDNVTLAVAPSHGKDIHSYNKKSFGSIDYKELALEFVERVNKMEA